MALFIAALIIAMITQPAPPVKPPLFTLVQPSPTPTPVEKIQEAPDTGFSAPPMYVAGPYAIPTYIVMCESGGNYRAENAYSTASGAYQIVDGTWNGYGGYSHASDAPPAVQDAKAAELWADGAGWRHWISCA